MPKLSKKNLFIFITIVVLLIVAFEIALIVADNEDTNQNIRSPSQTNAPTMTTTPTQTPDLSTPTQTSSLTPIPSDQYAVPPHATLSADAGSITSLAKIRINVHVTDAASIAVTGAEIKFSCDTGGTFSVVKNLGNGYYDATFTAPDFQNITICTITATIYSYYPIAQATIQLPVYST